MDTTSTSIPTRMTSTSSHRDLSTRGAYVVTRRSTVAFNDDGDDYVLFNHDNFQSIETVMMMMMMMMYLVSFITICCNGEFYSY